MSRFRQRVKRVERSRRLIERLAAAVTLFAVLVIARTHVWLNQ